MKHPENTDVTSLMKAAQDNLWMHFTRHSSYEGAEVPMIVRGEGSHIYDVHGKRYLDGLAGLFVVQAGHGRSELAEAAAKQAQELAFFPLWSYAHPKAVELAQRLAAETPGDLNRVFFTTGGGEAVESAWKLAKQYFKLTGKPLKHKVISRQIAYHGTPQGALSITGIPAFKQMFEPLVPGSVRVPNTNHYRADEITGVPGMTPEQYGYWAAERVARAIEMEAPTRWPPSSSSRCRTPEAASRRRPDTSSASVRSATSTMSCSSRTRSSAPSAASVPCSAGRSSTTSPTSSPAPRA